MYRSSLPPPPDPPSVIITSVANPADHKCHNSTSSKVAPSSDDPKFIRAQQQEENLLIQRSSVQLSALAATACLALPVGVGQAVAGWVSGWMTTSSASGSGGVGSSESPGVSSWWMGRGATDTNNGGRGCDERLGKQRVRVVRVRGSAGRRRGLSVDGIGGDRATEDKVLLFGSRAAVRPAVLTEKRGTGCEEVGSAVAGPRERVSLSAKVAGAAGRQHSVGGNKEDGSDDFWRGQQRRRELSGGSRLGFFAYGNRGKGRRRSSEAWEAQGKRRRSGGRRKKAKRGAAVRRRQASARTPTGWRGEEVRRYDASSFRMLKQDDRQCRMIEMKNGMKFLLIHDNKAASSVAAVTVDVGSSSDPKDVEGMAHFCEHMVFAGSEKYPVDGSYEAYLRRHGGFANAFTEDERTVFHFFVEPDSLRQSLDLLASHLAAPKFYKSCVKTEVKAVDLEWQGSEGGSWSAMRNSLYAIVNQKHPLSVFSAGNKQSLTKNGVDLRKRVREFFSEHYKPSAMAGVIISDHSLDELEKLTVKCFRKVRDTSHLFRNNRPRGERKKRDPSLASNCDVNLSKSKDAAGVPLNFPAGKELWVENCGDDASFVFHISHFGEATSFLQDALNGKYSGSLLDTLENMEEVEDISLNFKPVPGDGTYLMWIMLCFSDSPGTREDKIQKVGDTLAAYFKEIRAKGPPVEWASALSELAANVSDYAYVDRDEYEDWAADMAQSLFVAEKKKDVTSLLRQIPVPKKFGKRMMSEWKKELDCYKVENLAVIFDGTGKPTNKSAKYQSEKFGVGNLRSSWRDSWLALESGKKRHSKAKAFALPPPMTFVPKKFSMRKMDGPKTEAPLKVELPAKIADKATLLWKRDQKFGIPRTSIVMRISSPKIESDKRNYLNSILFGHLLVAGFDRRVLSAPEANTYLTCDVESPGTLTLRLESFSETTPALMRMLTKVMTEGNGFVDTDKVFAISSVVEENEFEKLQKSGLNIAAWLSKMGLAKNKIIESCTDERLEDMERQFGVNTVDDKTAAAAFADSSPRGPNKISPVFEKAHVEFLIDGNVTKKEALNIVEEAVTCLGIRHGFAPKRESLEAFDILEANSEADHPLRLQFNDPISRGPNRGALVIVYGKATEEMEAFKEFINESVQSHFVQHMRNDGKPIAYHFSAFPFSRDGLVAVEWNWLNKFDTETNLRHVESGVHDVFRRLSNKSAAWFEAQKALLLRRKTIEDASCTMLDKLSVQEKDLRKGSSISPGVAGVTRLKAMTHSRFVQLCKEYSDKPWIASISQTADAPKSYTGKWAEPSKPAAWVDGRSWSATNLGRVASNEDGSVAWYLDGGGMEDMLADLESGVGGEGNANILKRGLRQSIRSRKWGAAGQSDSAAHNLTEGQAAEAGLKRISSRSGRAGSRGMSSALMIESQELGRPESRAEADGRKSSSRRTTQKRKLVSIAAGDDEQSEVSSSLMT